MRSPLAWSYVTYLASSTVLLGACPPPSATTSADSEDSTTSQLQSSGSTDECPIGDVGCPCTQGGACNAGLVCSPDHRCVSDDVTTTDGPTGTTTTDEPSTTMADPTSATTEPTAPCDPGDGQPNPDCLALDPSKPYCSDAKVCGDCTVLPADGCAQIDPSAPICNPEDGKCVACTIDDDSLCTGATPACNPVTNTCEGCFEHSHCPDSACDVLKRECFPTDQVIYVRLGVTGDPSNPCTDAVGAGDYQDLPYCNANLALEHVKGEAKQSGWTFLFVETKWFNSFHGSIAVPSAPANSPVSYAFVHVGDYSQEDASQHQHTRLQSAGPVFTVGENVTAYIHNFGLYSVNVQGDNGVGVSCSKNSTVFLDDSFIRDTRGAGIRSFGCDIWLRRSSVYQSKTEGVELNCAEKHCTLHMVNSHISENKHFQGQGGGGIVAENATLDIVFSTLLGNNAEVDPNDMYAFGDSIHCVGDQVDGLIRNSVIGRKQMGNAQSIKCGPELKVEYSLVDSEEFAVGNSKKAGEDILGYFLLNTITGARPINPKPVPKGASVADLQIAVWQKGDPQVDYDREARPAKHGGPDFVGADFVQLNP